MSTNSKADYWKYRLAHEQAAHSTTKDAHKKIVHQLNAQIRNQEAMITKIQKILHSYD